MTEPIRWGILGASNFAATEMGPAIQMAEGAVLAGLATGSPEKAARFRTFAPGVRIFDSYDALLADPGIHAIYVPLPNTMHVDFTLKAIAAGKAVLTEKPIAMGAEEIDRLIAARDQSGVLAAEAYMIVHHPQWQRARDLLAARAVGRLIHVEAIFTYDNRHDTANIRNQAELGGGALPDIGVYTIGSVRFATGEEPRDIRAQIDWEDGVDATSRVHVQFADFTQSMLVSMRMARRQEVTFHGEAGHLRLTAPFNAGSFGEARIEITDADGLRVERFPTARQYVAQVEAFGRSLREDRPYPWTLEDARGTQAVIDAAIAADRRGVAMRIAG